MKRIYAAALMGGLCGPAAAAAVTVYGVADVHVSHYRHSDGSITSMESGGLGGSRVGMRGAEDLGDGRQAIFVLEAGFNINNGTSGQSGRLFGRQSYVGLRDQDLGSLIAGRLQGLGYIYGGVYDPMMVAPGSVLGSLTGENARPWMYNPLADPARMDNAVLYTSPKWGGFELGYQHGFRDDAGVSALRSKRFDLASLTYAEGPLSMTYGFGHSAGTTAQTAATSDQTEHALGVRYVFPWATLFATYQLRKTDGYSGSDQAWQVGAQVPAGRAGRIHLAYGRATNDTPFGPTDATAGWGVKSWAVGYVYSLSTRTTLYAYFKQLDNDGKAKQSIFPPGGLNPPSRFDDKVTAFGIGMQHRF
ncbi:porin [Bordetella hinzii]|uniref:porin n=1 Tax=Bordetella hinzii TaxID=103855 RepID=UPI00045B512F|nr:porin [Bordetella hinzii]KCB46534.1 putative outer membrane porin protein BP0840 [Bordetella hinzii 4161]QII86696.1 porin [Bordetella hinzii]